MCAKPVKTDSVCMRKNRASGINPPPDAYKKFDCIHLKQIYNSNLLGHKIFSSSHSRCSKDHGYSKTNQLTETIDTCTSGKEKSLFLNDSKNTKRLLFIGKGGKTCQYKSVNCEKYWSGEYVYYNNEVEKVNFPGTKLGINEPCTFKKNKDNHSQYSSYKIQPIAIPKSRSDCVLFLQKTEAWCHRKKSFNLSNSFQRHFCESVKARQATNAAERALLGVKRLNSKSISEQPRKVAINLKKNKRNTFHLTYYKPMANYGYRSSGNRSYPRFDPKRTDSAFLEAKLCAKEQLCSQIVVENQQLLRQLQEDKIKQNYNVDRIKGEAASVIQHLIQDAAFYRQAHDHLLSKFEILENDINSQKLILRQGKRDLNEAEGKAALLKRYIETLQARENKLNDKLKLMSSSYQCLKASLRSFAAHLSTVEKNESVTVDSLAQMITHGINKMEVDLMAVEAHLIEKGAEAEVDTCNFLPTSEGPKRMIPAIEGIRLVRERKLWQHKCEKLEKELLEKGNIATNLKSEIDAKNETLSKVRLQLSRIKDKEDGIRALRSELQNVRKELEAEKAEKESLQKWKINHPINKGYAPHRFDKAQKSNGKEIKENLRSGQPENGSKTLLSSRRTSTQSKTETSDYTRLKRSTSSTRRSTLLTADKKDSRTRSASELKTPGLNRVSLRSLSRPGSRFGSIADTDIGARSGAGSARSATGSRKGSIVGDFPGSFHRSPSVLSTSSRVTLHIPDNFHRTETPTFAREFLTTAEDKAADSKISQFFQSALSRAAAKVGTKSTGEGKGRNPSISSNSKTEQQVMRTPGSPRKFNPDGTSDVSHNIFKGIPRLPSKQEKRESVRANSKDISMAEFLGGVPSSRQHRPPPRKSTTTSPVNRTFSGVSVRTVTPRIFSENEPSGATSEALHKGASDLGEFLGAAPQSPAKMENRKNRTESLTGEVSYARQLLSEYTGGDGTAFLTKINSPTNTSASHIANVVEKNGEANTDRETSGYGLDKRYSFGKMEQQRWAHDNQHKASAPSTQYVSSVQSLGSISSATGDFPVISRIDEIKPDIRVTRYGDQTVKSYLHNDFNLRSSPEKSGRVISNDILYSAPMEMLIPTRGVRRKFNPMPDRRVSSQNCKVDELLRHYLHKSKRSDSLLKFESSVRQFIPTMSTTEKVTEPEQRVNCYIENQTHHGGKLSLPVKARSKGNDLNREVSNVSVDSKTHIEEISLAVQLPDYPPDADSLVSNRDASGESLDKGTEESIKHTDDINKLPTATNTALIKPKPSVPQIGPFHNLLSKNIYEPINDKFASTNIHVEVEKEAERVESQTKDAPFIHKEKDDGIIETSFGKQHVIQQTNEYRSVSPSIDVASSRGGSARVSRPREAPVFNKSELRMREHG